MPRTWAIVALLCSSAGLVALLWPYLGDPPVPIDRVLVASGSLEVSKIPSSVQTPLRFAIGTMVSPQATFTQYARLAHLLSDELGRPVELVQRASYAETNQLVSRGDVDIAFVCSGAYVELARTSVVTLLVAPVSEGRSTYWSELIVPTASPIRRIEDIVGTQGLRIAYTDRLSNTGCAAPRAMLRAVGVDAERHLAPLPWTGSHDESIRLVAAGHADLAGVDVLVLRSMVRADPALATQVRTIARSEEYGAPPIIAAAKVPMPVCEEVARALTTMNQSPQGREILGELGLDGFAVVSDAAYDSVRAVQPRYGRGGHR